MRKVVAVVVGEVCVGAALARRLVPSTHGAGITGHRTEVVSRSTSGDNVNGDWDAR